MGCPVKFCSTSKLGNVIFLLVLIATLVIWGCHLNQPLFYAINKLHTLLPDSVWLSLNFIAYSKYFILSALLLILTFSFRRDKLKNVILLIIAYYIVFTVLKIAIGEARPYIVLPTDSFFWLNKFEDSVHSAYKSFPSGHTGGMALLVFASMSLFFPNSRLAQTLLLLLLILTGLARICTGWHWPVDVLASGLISYVLVRVFLPNNITE